MSSILKVDEIQDTSGNNIINENANTVTIGKSGDTVNVIGTLQNNGSGLVSGITEADQWRLSALLTGDANPISSNLERVDSSGFNYIGSGMTESSGVFTFPSTGIYYITWQFTNRNDSTSSRYSRVDLDVTTNNSTYTGVAYAMTALSYVSSSTYGGAMGQYIFDVTDTSTHKVRFAVEHATPASTALVGTTTENYTSFTFIKLGDT